MIKRNLKPLSPFLIILLIYGCAQPPIVGPGQLAKRSIEIRYLEADYDTAFRAATHAFFALGYTIKHSDKFSGILVGANESTDVGSKIGLILLFGVAGALVDTDKNQEITLLLDKGPENKRTTLRIQMLINGKAQIDPIIVDSIWVVAQREAMIIKGIPIPSALEEKYESLQNKKLNQANGPSSEDQ